MELCFEAKDKLLRKFRQNVSYYSEIGEYKTALFFSNKVLSFDNSTVNDVYQQAKCFFQRKEYHRASHAIVSRGLHKTDLACRHLAAKCHSMAKEYKDAFDILGDLEDGEFIKLAAHEDLDSQLLSSIYLLRGQIHEAMDNRTEAVECFKKALQLDVYCFEALQSLIQHQMLSEREEEELMGLLNLSEQCEPDEENMIGFLYRSQLKKYAKPGELVIPEEYESLLSNNVDVLTCLAERHYYNCDFIQCLQITNKVLEIDVYHTQCLPIHLSCLMELKKTNVLFELAHKLVDLYPESSTAWYAVGCYYLMIFKTEAARRFLSKATTLDVVFGPAWLLYGHSFAIESEHDQAMAAYFKASHLMKGCHLPLLYIGLEYGLTENTKLAEKFFNQALAIAPQDPAVLHELGVISFSNAQYVAAEKYFSLALALVREKKDINFLPEKWEPLLNNMGHVLRKLKRYDEALEYHRQALVLVPLNPSSYTAIGYIYLLTWKRKLAVDYFHKALGLKRDDQVSKHLFEIAIEHLSIDSSLTKDLLLEAGVNIYEDTVYIKEFLSKTSASDSDEQIGDDNDLYKSFSENETENESSALDVEMELNSDILK